MCMIYSRKFLSRHYDTKKNTKKIYEYKQIKNRNLSSATKPKTEFIKFKIIEILK